MNITQIVFSPTGGTERAADIITARLGESARKLDLTDPSADFAEVPFERDSVVLIAVPSYGGRVPAPAAERIAKLRGNQARCVVLTVYGNRAYEDTLLELSDLAVGSGFRVIAAAAAVAEHSILHQYATGRPDSQDEEQLRGFAVRMLEKLRNGAEDAPVIPGNRPYRKAGGAGLVPKATKACVGCGLCAAKCPTGAISKQNPKKTDSKACISCMRCVSLCPHGARKASGLMTSIAGMAIKKPAPRERATNCLFNASSTTPLCRMHGGVFRGRRIKELRQGRSCGRICSIIITWSVQIPWINRRNCLCGRPLFRSWRTKFCLGS